MGVSIHFSQAKSVTSSQVFTAAVLGECTMNCLSYHFQRGIQGQAVSLVRTSLLTPCFPHMTHFPDQSSELYLHIHANIATETFHT